MEQFLALLTAAFFYSCNGFVWYNPKVFGTIWMNESSDQ
jgi:UDP-N-acetylmuramyl pentapeptide phosphotransferase/UDP-N-acetylglucosamine-1-phosphate transferase